MNTLLLLLALALAAPTPPEIEIAIRAYHTQQVNEAASAAYTALANVSRSPEPRNAPGAAPRLLAVIRPGTTAPLTSAIAGEPLVLLGTDLPPDGRVIIAHREATVTRRTAMFYELTAPAVTLPSPLPTSGPVDLFVGNAFQARLTNSFTLSSPSG